MKIINYVTGFKNRLYNHQLTQIEGIAFTALIAIASAAILLIPKL